MPSAMKIRLRVSSAGIVWLPPVRQWMRTPEEEHARALQLLADRATPMTVLVQSVDSILTRDPTFSRLDTATRLALRARFMHELEMSILVAHI